ncbi:MAG: tetratricopeptide repeat protein [Planctomycetes bacterium]|nr:tetratricopeptide repeat protein [Planctomycetota bacterium]
MAKSKKINKNLIGGLTALAFVVMTGAGIMVVNHYRLSDPTELVRRAEEFEKAKDWKSAGYYYRRAYKAAEDPTYLLRYGDMLRSMGLEFDAIKVYRDVTIMAPTRLDALEKTLEIQLEVVALLAGTRNWGDIKETSEAILALDGQDQHPRALFALGSALFRLKEQAPENEGEGIRNLELAVQNSPNEFKFARRLASFYSEMDRDEDAAKLYTNLIAQTTTPGLDAAEARCLWGKQLLKKGKYEEAQASYADAMKMAGSEEDVKALVHRKTGRFWTELWTEKKFGFRAGERVEAAPPEEREEAFTAASKELRAAISIDPDDSESYRTLANLLASKSDHDGAIELYLHRLDRPFPRDGLQKFKSRQERYNLLLGLANQYIFKVDLAEKGTSEQDEWAKKAHEQIDEALSEAPNGTDAYHARGRLNFTLGKNREAIQAFEEAEKFTRGLHWRNSYFLASARMRDNQIGAAKEAITKAISDPRAVAACWVLYAEILIREDRPNPARLAAERALAMDPGNHSATLIRAAAQEKLGQTDIANETILGMEGGTPEFMANKAAYIAKRGDIDGALALIENALKEHPAHPRVVAIGVSIYNKLDRREDATRIIEEALAQAPDNFELAVLKIAHSGLSKEERVQQFLEKVNEIKDGYERAIRLASYYGEQKELDKQYEQFKAAKKLLRERSTGAARRAGESGLRSLIEAMFAIAIETNNTARMDELVAEATEYGDSGLDQAHGLTYKGRRHLYDGFMANKNAHKARQESRLKEAEALSAEGRAHNEAATEVLLEAIDLYPTNGSAFAGLGDAYRRLGELNEARIAYERAIDLTPQNGRATKQLALIAEALGNDDDYQKWFEKCRKLLPEDPWVLERTLVAQEEENPREGVARREELLKENPEDARNLQKLASLYASLGDYEEAKQRVDQLLALPDGHRFARAAATLLRKIQMPEQALEVLQNNLRTAAKEDKASAQLLIGEHFRAVRNVAAADDAFLAAADIEPSQPVFVAIGRHFTVTARFGEADKWLQKALQKAEESASPQKSRIQIMRIEALTQNRSLDEADALCKAYEAEYPDDPSSLYLASQIASSRGDIDTTIEKITLFLEQRPDTNIALYSRAQALASVGEWHRAITDLERLRATNPTALALKPRILLSEAYEHVGRLDMAFAELESAHKDHPEASNIIDKLISLYAQHERFADADNILTTLLNTNPDQIGWLLRSGEIALRQKDYTKAIATQKKAATLGEFHPTLTVTLLETFGKVDLAQQGIKFFEEVPPDRRTPIVLLAYANLLGQSGDLQAAINTFRTALHKSGFDSFEFLEKVAASVNVKLGSERAIELFSQPVDEVLAKSNKHILSALLQSAGRIDEALELCQSLLEEAGSKKEKASIFMRIAVAYGKKGQQDKEREAYENALALDEDNLFALNNLAYLLSDKLDKPTEALPYAQRAGKISDLPAVLDTLGWVYYQLGRYQEAIAQFTRIRRIEPDFDPSTYHLAESFRRAGDFDKAKTIFTEVIGDGQDAARNEFVAKSQEGLRLANEQNSD